RSAAGPRSKTVLDPSSPRRRAARPGPAGPMLECPQSLFQHYLQGDLTMKAPFRRALLGALVLTGLATAAIAPAAEEWTRDPRQNAALPRATRADLYKALDSYLAALKARDPQRVKWAARVRNTENNVAIMVGDGLWGTITALGSYDL